MDFNDLPEELKAKAKACTSPEELMALAREEGRALSDEELEGIAGGVCWEHEMCPWLKDGDVRDDVDESHVPEAFMTGQLRGDGLD